MQPTSLQGPILWEGERHKTNLLHNFALALLF